MRIKKPLNTDGRNEFEKRNAVTIKLNNADIMKKTKSNCLCVNARNMKDIIMAFNAINIKACAVSILTKK